MVLSVAVVVVVVVVVAVVVAVAVVAVVAYRDELYRRQTPRSAGPLASVCVVIEHVQICRFRSV